MRKLDKLVFFDKNGEQISLKYDNGVWSGSVHFKSVSVDLIENATLYILEENKINNQIIYNRPLNESDFIGYINVNDKFSLFKVDNPQADNPTIKIEKNIIEYTDKSNYIIADGYKILTDADINAIRYDIMFRSNEGGSFVDHFYIKDDSGIFVDIELYSEAIQEDERLSILLSNLGEDLTNDIEYIFRTSDVNEDISNQKILNQKRKELLLEFDNIFPYISADKGLVNMIKFFGYGDLKIKKYWKNIQTNKFYFEDFKLYEYDKLDVKNILLQHPYQPTSYFGLFYDISTISDEYDEDGLPIVIDKQIFSNEEILIKLFGLKQYLQNRSVGGNAKIIDIIGEITNFNKYTIKKWSNDVSTQHIDSGISPEFEISSTFGYIEDLRYKNIDFSSCALPREFIIQDNPNVQLGRYNNCFVGWFSQYRMDTFEAIDAPNIKVGYPISLKNTTYKTPINSIKSTWAAAKSSAITATWKNISNIDCYEVEWTIENTDKNFKLVVGGDVYDYSNIDIILPFSGYYSVSLKLLLYNNQTAVTRKNRLIEVQTKNADFVCFFRYYNKYLQRWNTNPFKWNRVNASFKSEIRDNKIFTKDEIKNRTYKTVKYVDTDRIGDPHTGIKSPKWNTFSDNVVFSDLKFVNFKHLIHGSDRNASFAITNIGSGEKYLNIGSTEIRLSDDITVDQFERLAEEIQTKKTGDIISYDYLARTVDTNITSSFVDCVAVEKGVDGEIIIGSNSLELSYKFGKSLKKYTDFTNTKWRNINTKWRNTKNLILPTSDSDPFTMDNVNIYDGAFSVPVFVPIFMSIDNSKMCGKTRVVWKISLENETIFSIESYSLVYRFISANLYTISVDIYDTNGNISSIKKTNLINVLSANNFQKLLNETYKQKNQPF